MSDEKFNLNDLVMTAKEQKGLIIEKKKETAKPAAGAIPPETEKAINDRISEEDELINLAKTNPADPKIQALKQAYLFRQTGHVPSLDAIKMATGTDEESKKRAKINEDGSVNVPSISLDDLNKMAENVEIDETDESNDLLKGKNIIKESDIKKMKEGHRDPVGAKGVEGKPFVGESTPAANHDPKGPVHVEEKQPEIVVIEKNIPGELNFTADEKTKLAKADYIELREITGLELPTKVTKIERGTVGSIIEKRTKKFTTEMTPFVSGYVATVKALNPGDLLDIIFPTGESPIQEEIFRWTKIYESIQSTSIGKMSFDQFCHNTSALDFNLFLLAILIATYSADKQSIEIICKQPEHGEEGYKFKCDVDYRQLMRVESLSDRAIDLIVGAADASKTLEEAKSWHDKSPLLTRKYFKLPSGIIFALQLESVYDSINNHYQAIEEMVKESQINAKYALVARHIPRLYVQDEETGETLLLEDIRDIVAYLRTLSPDDMEIINNKTIELMDGLDVKFGLKDVKCPMCGDVTEFVQIDLENELFTKASQSNQKKYV